jgi:6-pyruvoyltetrahydropterin/6-carboxytetrahydropterin synthase
MELEVEFTFSAAHRLPRHPGKCMHVHGHNYRFTVTIAGEPDSHSGMIMDFGDIDAVVREQILTVVDHRDLNEFLENPTAENVVVWFWERLAPHLPGLTQIRLWEMDTASVTYRGGHGGS